MRVLKNERAAHTGGASDRWPSMLELSSMVLTRGETVIVPCVVAVPATLAW